jgi:hypothetical protein
MRRLVDVVTTPRARRGRTERGKTAGRPRVAVSREEWERAFTRESAIWQTIEYQLSLSPKRNNEIRHETFQGAFG